MVPGQDIPDAELLSAEGFVSRVVEGLVLGLESPEALRLVGEDD